MSRKVTIEILDNGETINVIQEPEDLTVEANRQMEFDKPDWIAYCLLPVIEQLSRLSDDALKARAAAALRGAEPLMELHTQTPPFGKRAN